MLKTCEKSVKIVEASLYFLPVEMRVPLKFGNQTLSSVTCARARVIVEGTDGKTASGWGETPLSVGWVWPADIDYENRHSALKDFTILLAGEIQKSTEPGHPVELGHAFIEGPLESLRESFNSTRKPEEAMPHLAALVCFSLFDIAVHDAFGNLLGVPVYETYGPDLLPRDLSDFLEPGSDTVSFEGKHLSDFLLADPPRQLPVWHLVGGLDPVSGG